MKHAIVQADARSLPMADGCAQCVVTSVPYWGLRDYGLPETVWGGDATCAHEWGNQLVRTKGGIGQNKGLDNGQAYRDERDTKSQTIKQGQFCAKCDAWRGCLGLEPTPELYAEHIVEVFRDARRVLRDDGVLFLNIGDSYANDAKWGGTTGGKHAKGLHGSPIGRLKRNTGLKQKDRVGIPHMLAFALRADGWYWRDEIVWHKPNPMPESVTDRCTKAHEFIFVFSKSPRYFYDADAIREPVTSTGGASFGKQNHDATGTMAQSRALADPSERNHPLGRNKRSVWTISTQSCPEAHFATFPIKLPLLCIQAGTSERGCCPKCGAPWRRVMTKIPTGQTQKAADGWDTGDGGHGNIHRDGRQKGATGVPVMARVTVNWQPSCACAAGDPVPCLVLDNFNGAGTTGMAAMQLGRSYIGTELKREYIDLSLTRWAKFQAKLAAPNARRTKKPKAVKGEVTLFGVEAA